MDEGSVRCGWRAADFVDRPTDQLPVLCLAGLPTYNLTTVRQPVAKMVEAALEILFERIDNPAAESA